MRKFTLFSTIASLLVTTASLGADWLSAEVAQKNSQMMVEVMNDVSKDWSEAAIKRHLDPAVYALATDRYRETLKKYSYLGRFVRCDDLEVGPVEHPDMKKTAGIHGICEFEHDKAKVLLMFLNKGKTPKLVVLDIGDAED